MHTDREFSLIERCNTPSKVQSFLDSLQYDPSRYIGGTYVVRSFRRTLRDGKALCLCGALTAAHFLEMHGHKPLVIDLRGERLDHVVAIYGEGKIGAIGKSKHQGAQGRHATYYSERELAKSYADYLKTLGNKIYAFAVIDLRK